MDNDKPFACTAPSCGMRFTNEDHLTVHRKKHEMLLSLNMESAPSKCNNTAIFVDQTPTPTRFIRNCEDVSLFQDLQSMNPFEEHFRKAVEVSKSGNPPTVESLQIASDSDVLNTPSVLPADLEADTCGTNVDDSAEISLPTEQPNASKNADDSNRTNAKGSIDASPEKEVVLDDAAPAADDVGDDDIHANSTAYTRTVSFPPSVSPTSSDNSLGILSLVNKHVGTSSQHPVTRLSDLSEKNFPTELPDIDCAARPSSPLNGEDMMNCGLRSSSKIISQLTENTSAIGSNGIVQLILRLPDGQTLPVHIPALPMLTGSSTSLEPRKLTCIPPNIMSHEIMSSKNLRNTSFAKLKLRQSLTHNKSNSALRASTERPSWFSSEALNLDSTSNDSDFHRKLNNASGRKRGAEEDPDEKRRRFLERNRAAAIRCRQKRKHWIQSLESKADELTGVNQQLQNEVAMLRNEVSHLKSMLLAHKDCPVTQQQQKQMVHLNGILPSSTVFVGTSSGEIQRSAAEAIATSALTNLAGNIESSLDNSSLSESFSPSLSPVVLRTFVTREQAVALLTMTSMPEASNAILPNTNNTVPSET